MISLCVSPFEHAAASLNHGTARVHSEPATCRSTEGLHGLGAEGEWTTQHLTKPVDVVFPSKMDPKKGFEGGSGLGSREEALDLGGHQDSAALWAAKP